MISVGLLIIWPLKCSTKKVTGIIIWWITSPWDASCFLCCVDHCPLILMTQVLLFYIKIDDIYKNTIKCVYSLKDEHWDNISDEGKDLIKKLLEKKP